MSIPQFVYVTEGKLYKVYLGHEKGWLEVHREQLDSASMIGLILNDKDYIIKLKPGQRWVYFKRTFKKTESGFSMGIYCIGWQETVEGRNVKSLLWIYPDGSIEVGDEPLKIHTIMQGVG